MAESLPRVNESTERTEPSARRDLRLPLILVAMMNLCVPAGSEPLSRYDRALQRLGFTSHALDRGEVVLHVLVAPTTEGEELTVLRWNSTWNGVDATVRRLPAKGGGNRRPQSRFSETKALMSVDELKDALEALGPAMQGQVGLAVSDGSSREITVALDGARYWFVMGRGNSTVAVRTTDSEPSDSRSNSGLVKWYKELRSRIMKKGE